MFIGIKIYNAVVVTTLLYGAETWATTKQHEQRIDGFDSGCLRSILKIRWWHHTPNSVVRELTRQPYASTLLKRSRMRWYGHVQRMATERIPNRMLNWDPTVVGGKRKQGGQRQRWIESCTNDFKQMGLTQSKALKSSRDRGEWRSTLSALL